MRTPKFFRIVWRVDAVLVLLVGIGLVVLLIVWVIELGSDFFEPSPSRSRDVVKVEGESGLQSSFRMGSFEEVGSSAVFWAPLHSVQESSGRTGSWKSTATRNYYFHDAHERVGRWLVDGNDLLFTSNRRVWSRGEYDDSGSVLGVLYEVVESDTNGDGELTEDDVTSLAFSDARGRGYTVATQGIEGISDYSVLSDSVVVVLCRTGEDVRAIELDFDSMEVLHDSSVVSVPE